MLFKDYYLTFKKLWNWVPADHTLPSMNHPLELVASFSQDVTQFAFQANLSQKNTVDIYSLDDSNNYCVNSSLVNHVDYESNDLKASDALFMGWCNSIEENTKPKTKRSHSDGENGKHIIKKENYFINGFPEGKVVVYSSTGKDILNIIQSKREILHADTEGEFIWTLDTAGTVKKFQYDQTKPSKTFQISDVKDDGLKLFHILPRHKGLYLAIASKEKVYIFDPSGEELVNVATFDMNDCVACELLSNGEKVVLANTKEITLFDTTNGEALQRWDASARKLKVMEDIILCLTTDGSIVTYKIGHNQFFGKVKIAHFQIIQFTQVENALLIAWLNVNEPNFKLILLEEIQNGNDLIIQDGMIDNEVFRTNDDLDSEGQKETPLNQESDSPKKNFSRAEQDELSQSLIESLDKEDERVILERISSSNWTEQRIKSFIVFHVQTQDRARLIFEVVSSNFQGEVWKKDSVPAEWLKWILTLRGDRLDNRHTRKHTKQLRSALRISGDSLPTLIGIQGRLEMLKNQAQLREDLSKLAVAEGGNKEDNVSHDDPVEEHDDSISYVNGESDTFVDATEKEPATVN